jgi:membrane protein DedA with SNARE-associated domain
MIEVNPLNLQETALHVINTYKYPGIFLLFIIDTMGVFLPTKTILTLCGLLVQKGQLNLLPLFFSTLAGSLTGFCVSYVIGIKVGMPLLERYGKYLLLTPDRYKKAVAWFYRFGPAFILIAYFTPGLRHITPYLAGITRMPFRKVIIFASAGASLWVLTFVSLGRLLGKYVDINRILPEKYLPAAVLALLAAAGLIMAIKYKRKR